METRVSCILFDGISITQKRQRKREKEIEEGNVERRLARKKEKRDDGTFGRE